VPPRLIGKSIWKERCEDIAGFERYLGRSGFAVRKIFLHVSRDEQKRRLLERLDDPDAIWKFDPGDVTERGHWDEYMDAYQDAIRATATDDSPWYIVPGDKKWFARLVVAQIIADTLRDLDPRFPRIDARGRRALAAAREQLDSE
jgi:polyphosphate kinase 2 (PPK2 family)